MIGQIKSDSPELSSDFTLDTHLAVHRTSFCFFLAAIPKRSHPFPSRTRKLSSSGPMVLQGQPCGRVGRCRGFEGSLERVGLLLFSAQNLVSRFDRGLVSRFRSRTLRGAQSADSAGFRKSDCHSTDPLIASGFVVFRASSCRGNDPTICFGSDHAHPGCRTPPEIWPLSISSNASGTLGCAVDNLEGSEPRSAIVPPHL
jgi:hypothetical protein